MSCAGITRVIWYVWSFSYIRVVGISLVDSLIERLSSFWSVGSFSYTPRDGIRLVIRRLGSLSYTSPA